MSEMFVGRVGGLAVALGIGAAAFNAAGLAWADSGSPDQATGPRSTGTAEHQKPTSSTSTPSRQRGTRAAASANPAARSDNAPAASATTRVRPSVRPVEQAPERASASPTSVEAPSGAVDTAATPEVAAPTVSIDAPASAATAVAQVAAPATAAPDPDPAPVSGALSNVELADLLGGGGPTAPADTPIEWAAMAVARRESALAASATAPAAAQVAAAATVPIPGGCSQTSTSCALIFGPSGVPVPSGQYAANARFLYLDEYMPEGYDAQIVYSPEGAYPVTGIKEKPLPISADLGLQILIDTLQVLQPDNTENPIPITVFGFSQSAVISSRLQRELQANPALLPGVDRDLLSFVTVGQEMGPNGGWFARFPGFNTPSLGEFFYGSTGYAEATDTGDPQFAYPIRNFTLEYDGFGDSPRYPMNFISALNAALGILLVHTNYNTPAYFARTYGLTDPITLDGPAKACEEGSSSFCRELPVLAIPGQPVQKYFFLETPNLPLLAPLRLVPFIGNPLADLIQPVLKVIVDLGYGDPAHGFNSSTQPYANVATPFGVFPQVSAAEVFQRVVDGIREGITDFIGAFGPSGSLQQEFTAMGNSLVSALSNPPTLKVPSLNNLLTDVQNGVVEIASRISAGASALYATLLATADFINAGVTSLPGYGISLIIDGIKQAIDGQPIQGLINAVGRPIGAVVGMLATIITVQVTVWLEGIFAAITGCGPAAPTAGLCIIPGVGP